MLDRCNCARRTPGLARGTGARRRRNTTASGNCASGAAEPVRPQGGAQPCRSSKTSACRRSTCPSSCAASRRSCASTRRRRRSSSTPARARSTRGRFFDLHNPTTSRKLSALAEQIHTLALEHGRHHQHAARHRPGAHALGGPAVRAALSGLPPAQGDLRSARTLQPRQDRRSRAEPTGLALAAPAALDTPRRQRWELQWADDAVATESSHCNGCGQCRTEPPGQRMCPIFRAEPNEAATPRAKANLMRHLLDRRPGRAWRLGLRRGARRSPTCASIARCAPTSARPTSTFPS